MRNKPPASTPPPEKEKKEVKPQVTIERRGFVTGLLNEVSIQLKRFIELVEQSASLQAQIQITERNLKLTRDHLVVVLGETAEEVPHENWREYIAAIRFVGARLGDACMEILREHGTMTTAKLRDYLNHGHYRFKTDSPLREIHAALLRQKEVTRDAETDTWIFKAK